jgi:hypothetical protein
MFAFEQIVFSSGVFAFAQSKLAPYAVLKNT